MALDDEYVTIESEAVAEIKTKGSRFIGAVAPVLNVIAAENFILQQSKRYFNATHHCYAYRIIANNRIITRSSDAGEPKGTAGLHILNIIASRNLLNIIVVITRYFGGTKLGKGGLARAYAECTQAVLDQCRIEKKIRFANLCFSFPYDCAGNVMRVLSQLDGTIKSSTYDNQIRLDVEISQSLTCILKKKLLEATSGKIEFK